jgi:hypothetical protein
MRKFLIEGSRSPASAPGLVKNKALGRRAAVKNALAALGGQLKGADYAALALAATASDPIGTRSIHPGFSALDRVADPLRGSNL